MLTRLKAVRTAAAATAAAGLTLLATATPAAATPASSAEAAVSWLTGQFVDGDHIVTVYGPGVDDKYDDQGRTIDAILGLAAAQSGTTTIAKALTWLATQIDAYTSWDGGDWGGPYDGSVAKLALVAQVTGNDPTSFGGKNLLQKLKDDQCTADDTGADCAAPGAARNIFSSISESLAILVRSRAGGDYAPDAAAVDYFLSLQTSIGGFTQETDPSDDVPGVDETSYAVYALRALSQRSIDPARDLLVDAALVRAAHWLDDRPHEQYWESQGGPNISSTGLASAALDGVQAARSWLANQQYPNGALPVLAGEEQYDASKSTLATAQGLLGLAEGNNNDGDNSLATLTYHVEPAPAPTPSSTAPSASPSPSTTPKPMLSRQSVQSGGTVGVTGGGFTPGERVEVWLHSNPVRLATVTAAGGTVSTDVTIPADTPAGDHRIELRGLISGATGFAPLTVYAPTPTNLKQGSSFTLTLYGFRPNELIDAYLHSAPILLANERADSAGRATFHLTIPKDAPAGSHHIEFVGRSSGIVQSTATFVLPQVQVPMTDGPQPSGDSSASGGPADPQGSANPVPQGAVATQAAVDGLAATGAEGRTAVLQACFGALLVAAGAAALWLNRRRAVPVPVIDPRSLRNGRRRH